MLSASGIRRERGSRVVLDGVSLIVGPGDRIGVVGPNGVGKSTLLRILAGGEPADGGRVERSPLGAAVGYFAQERERSAETVLDYLARRTGVAAAETALESAADDMASGRPGAGDAYAAALETWSSLGAADLPARAAAGLESLGLDASTLLRATATLSGGQAARVDLAAVLLSRFDITLLDEPTNDLDFDGLERLEGFLLSRTGGLVVVSHDRAFLERVITGVVELEEQTGRAQQYRGGWLAFLEEKATARRHAEEAYDTYQSRRRELTDRSARERQWATSGVTREKKAQPDNDKAQRDFRINRTEKLAARARRTERALERLEAVDKPWEGWTLNYTIGQAPRAGSLVAALDGAVVQRGEFRIGPVDLMVGWGDRVALTGPNGSGKTTLIDALMGRLELAAGERRVGPGTRAGELGQRRERLDAEAALLEGFLRLTGLAVAEVRSLLAKFGLGAAHVDRPVASLSPGERTRAELAAFQAVGINFLVLDEPTNHLDLAAIEQLEEALEAFSGSLLLVSHDRRLLESVRLTGTLDLGALSAGGRSG